MVARRQLRMLLTSPLHLLVLVVLPFALGALTLLIPGHAGFGRAAPSSTNTHEAIEILAALNFAAVLLGTTASVGALVGERRVFRREQQLGLSATAYLLAKIAVFAVIAAAQAAIVTTIVIAGKGGPGMVPCYSATPMSSCTSAWPRRPSPRRSWGWRCPRSAGR